MTPETSTMAAFHYYDRHPTAEDLMGESVAQSQLIRYLIGLIGWLFRDTRHFVASDLNIYSRRVEHQYPLAPDVALFADVPFDAPTLTALRSWRTYEPGFAPPILVVEVASEATWERDLHEKPLRYDDLGVEEYILYDPNTPPFLADTRLHVWQRDGAALVPVSAAPDGRTWSATLASWLIPDGALLRLATSTGQLRLTRDEAQTRRADRERAAKERAWARLRALGIDPSALDDEN